MRFIYDHDFHIHSQLSLCSGDPEQNPQRILAYAKQNNLKKIVLTDHYWDERIPGASGWYQQQNTAWVSKWGPLPQADGIQFLMGAETDMAADGTIGVDRKTMERLDFVIVPTTHLHMGGFTCRGDEDELERAKLWVSRFEHLLRADLPFERVGLAHMTCSLIAYKMDYRLALRSIPDADKIRLFRAAADRGMGIELNFTAVNRDGVKMTWENDVDELRPYQLAKDCGCKFYIGSDAHKTPGLDAQKANAEAIIDLLGLTEDDKFAFAK